MNVRRRLAPAVLLLVSPVLVSCTVNFDEQTDKVYNVAAGVSDRSGQVDVLNALVVAAESGRGTVVATLVNNDQSQADTLKSVSGSGPDASLTVTPGGSTDIPASGLLNLATDGRIFVTGDKVLPGRTVQLTFTFEHAKSVTMTVPVVGDTAEYAGVTLPGASGSPSPGATATPSAVTSETPSAAPSEGASPGVSTSPSP